MKRSALRRACCVRGSEQIWNRVRAGSQEMFADELARVYMQNRRDNKAAVEGALEDVDISPPSWAEAALGEGLRGWRNSSHQGPVNYEITSAARLRALLTARGPLQLRRGTGSSPSPVSARHRSPQAEDRCEPQRRNCFKRCGQLSREPPRSGAPPQFHYRCGQSVSGLQPLQQRQE
ncbi:hypothetical protein NDU88_004598 [Pleurodeles waltl]|uniref:Uncharacterized protein n=1 Tax=Pleurodeles waltl TaxID=8319 RepID=A0AAV7UG66_PLEWA|nr:hypothetical protein NDU88_004598 [Pleurodeles waltl]